MRIAGRHDVGDVEGPVVAIDVIRAFSTAAYALAAGAEAIFLVADVEEALAFKAAHPGSVAMGEDGGLRPRGFDLPNSPVRASEFDLDGRLVVQRTSAGTRGVVAARSATMLWAASLVVASATAAATGVGPEREPTYLITGWFTDRPDRPGTDDRLTADYMEGVRRGERPDPREAADRVAASDEATRTLALGPEHVDDRDIEYACDVDRFDFAMPVERSSEGLRLRAVRP